MFFLYDNLVAAILGSAVLLILISINLRMLEMGREEVANYAAKRYGTDLAEWMEEDLLTLGRNIRREGGQQDLFKNPVDSAGMTKSFTFFRNDYVDGSSDSVAVAIRYSLRYEGKGEVSGEEVNFYRVVRDSSGLGGAPGTFVYTGSAVPLVSYFKLDLLDRFVQPISDPVNHQKKVRNTRVRFSLVTPFQAKDTRLTLRKVHYGSTLLVNHDQHEITLGGEPVVVQ